MNKSTLLTLLSIIPFFLSSQNIIEKNFPSKVGLIFYQDVVKIDSTQTIEESYLNAVEWISSNFKSTNAVIDSGDKEGGLLIIKGYVSKSHNNFIKNGKNWFVLKIEIKEGRFRYTLDQIRHEFDVVFDGTTTHFDEQFEPWVESTGATGSKSRRAKTYAAMTEYCQELNTSFQNIIDSLIASMRAKEEEW